MSAKGLLYIGHGTRQAQGVRECEWLTQAVDQSYHRGADNLLGDAAWPASVVQVQAMQHLRTQLCYLEICAPSIVDGVAMLVEQGVQEIAVQPLLLFAAGHMLQDIPTELAKAQRRFPAVRLQLGTPFGEDERILHAAAEHLLSAVWDASEGMSGGASEASGRRTAGTVLFVGRGSLDDHAHAAFLRVSAAVRALVQAKLQSTVREDQNLAFSNSDAVACSYRRRMRASARSPFELKWIPCSMTGKGASYAEALTACERGPVWILPYLLLTGRLSRLLQQSAQVWNSEHAGSSCYIAAHLGLHPNVTETLTERVTALIASMIG